MATLLISDIHLGRPSSRYKEVRSLIESTHFDQLIIVGDLFDHHNIDTLTTEEKSFIHFLKELLKKNRARGIWIPGNHDDALAHQIPDLLGTSVHHEYVWEEGGRRFMALHGHNCDGGTIDNRLIHTITEPIMRKLRVFDPRNLHIARWVETLYAHLSLSIYIMARNAMRRAKHRSASVVFCGHTHITHVYMDRIGGRHITYYNIGTWTRPHMSYALIEAGVVHLNIIKEKKKA